LIKLENISKAFSENVKAVSDLSFEVARGEILVLLGTSGCGKTTTLKMINRLIEPTRGHILIDGKDNKEQDVGTLKAKANLMIYAIKKVLKYSLVILIPPLLGFIAYFTDIIFFEVFGVFYSIPGQYISLAILYPSGITNHYLNLGLTTITVLIGYYCLGICFFSVLSVIKYIINNLLEMILGKDYISDRRKKELKSQIVTLIVTLAIGFFFHKCKPPVFS